VLPYLSAASLMPRFKFGWKNTTRRPSLWEHYHALDISFTLLWGGKIAAIVSGALRHVSLAVASSSTSNNAPHVTPSLTWGLVGEL